MTDTPGIEEEIIGYLQRRNFTDEQIKFLIDNFKSINEQFLQANNFSKKQVWNVMKLLENN